MLFRCPMSKFVTITAFRFQNFRTSYKSIGIQRRTWKMTGIFTFSLAQFLAMSAKFARTRARARDIHSIGAIVAFHVVVVAIVHFNFVITCWVIFMSFIFIEKRFQFYSNANQTPIKRQSNANQIPPNENTKKFFFRPFGPEWRQLNNNL